MFGRAGRPQYDDEGEGIILTTSNKVDEYSKMLTNQTAIESCLIGRIEDCLNAEIAIGTVANFAEAVQWMGFTYLSRRIMQNAQVYSMQFNEIANKTREEVLYSIIMRAARNLHNNKLIRFNAEKGIFNPTFLGRVASNYYIDSETISKFDAKLREFISDEQLFKLMADAHVCFLYN